MIEELKGNLLDSGCEYLVNTINCRGVMGKGVALQFKTFYPDLFKWYVKKFELGELSPGKLYYYEEEDLFTKTKIINLTTKDDWFYPSSYNWIGHCVLDLRDFFYDKPNATIAMPRIGCGCGGLSWENVRQIIIDHLDCLNATFKIYSL